ncbi:GNAT family N-acetyltransferase [Aquicoccus sp. G2-2]|uniref:GNAT family N-acetyltransferase n=1 Tax=Aquicoccus sp. G2-2 TaxID=3092120 RepID=UPI002AE02EED|nr:GNAT family N-acetyltransferase [Aquicoccus sp. G2-2]MEA1112834.1 GNAT family N-acetyltransferase [Aquicoccus sp. G2-2]
MSTLTLARPEDFDRLAPLVATFHAESGFETTEDGRRTAIEPLLEGTPHGVAYLIGPRRAPVGYIVISFGYSVEMGGIDGFIDEFFIRDKVRGRGMGTEVLLSLLPALGQHGVKALHLEVERGNARALRLYTKAGFVAREGYHLMTRQA